MSSPSRSPPQLHSKGWSYSVVRGESYDEDEQDSFVNEASPNEEEMDNNDPRRPIPRKSSVRVRRSPSVGTPSATRSRSASGNGASNFSTVNTSPAAPARPIIPANWGDDDGRRRGLSGGSGYSAFAPVETAIPEYDAEEVGGAGGTETLAAPVKAEDGVGSSVTNRPSRGNTLEVPSPDQNIQPRVTGRRRAGTIAARLQSQYAPLAGEDFLSPVSVRGSLGRQRGATLMGPSTGVAGAGSPLVTATGAPTGLTAPAAGRHRGHSVTQVAEEAEMERSPSIRLRFRSGSKSRPTSPSGSGRVQQPVPLGEQIDRLEHEIEGEERQESLDEKGKSEREGDYPPRSTQRKATESSIDVPPALTLVVPGETRPTSPQYQEDNPYYVPGVSSVQYGDGKDPFDEEAHHAAAGGYEDEHHLDHEVDLLEVIDHSVSTAAHMANIQNAIFAPPLPFLNRAPVVELDTPGSSRTSLVEGDEEGRGTDEEDLLDRHVLHAMKAQTKKEKFRKIMKGLWAFMKTPLGIFFTIYGILVVFWGAGLVLILIGAIPMSSYNKKLWVEIASQILNGLFTITGVGLFPFRLIDTYNILIISRYARKTRHRRKRVGLPKLPDNNDIPDRTCANGVKEKAAATDKDLPINIEETPVSPSTALPNGEGTSSTVTAGDVDIESGHALEREDTVLNDKEEMKLRKAQIKFMKSQTWYHPHESATHRAFPIKWALLICFFNDGNSIFQVGLCGVLWGFNRFTRPPWTTGILIPLSFGCGIIAAILIWKGSERTKKFTEVEKAVNGIIREREEEKKKRRLRIPHPHLPGHHHHEHDEEHPHGDHQKFGLMGRHE